MLDKGTVSETYWDQFSRPHVFVSLLLLVAFLLVCARKRKRPDVSQVVELVAYGAGLWGALTLFRAGARLDSEAAGAWETVAGGIILGVAAIKGVWDLLAKVGVEPEKK